jgi:hypothetical protein
MQDCGGQVLQSVAHYVDDGMETACGFYNFRLTHRRLPKGILL